MKNFSILMCFVAVTVAALTLFAVFNLNKVRDVVISSKSTAKADRQPASSIQSSLNISTNSVSGTQNMPVAPDQSRLPIVIPQSFVATQEFDKLYDPNSSVTFATGDILTIPEADRPFIRYLSLYNIPKNRRREVFGKVVSFLVNSLSTHKKMSIPEFLGASDETVIRLDIRNYDWPASAWEKLAREGSGPKPQADPYFHAFFDKPIFEKVKTKKIVTERVPQLDRFGRQLRDTQGNLLFTEKEVPREVEETVSNKRQRIPIDVPWLDQLGYKTLIAFTNSEASILRADWFIANVSLPPAYYNFLSLGVNIKDFEKLVFANDKLAEEARSQDKGIVVSSIVARNNRTLIRSPTFTGGYYWKSRDTLKSIEDRNYIQFLLDEKFDATEDIASLPNGLQVYFLADNKGARLDFADPNIALDHTAVDRLVRTGRSCMVCHSDGIRPINDEVRTLTRKLQNREQIQLLIPDKANALKIEDLFSSDLDEQIVKDQNLYRSAVARATGVSSEVISRMLNEVYNDYVERLLTAETISREVGVSLSELEAYIVASKDNLVLGLIKTPIRPIRRDQWEQSFQRFMILIMARKQGLDHADPVPPGPLVPKP